MSDGTDEQEGDTPGSEQPTVDAPRGATPPPIHATIRALHGFDPRTPVRLPDAEPETAPSDDDARRTPSGRYDVGPEIARGGMGAILRVRDRELCRALAMKVLLGQGPDGPQPGGPVTRDHLNRFLEEAQVTAQLAHPGVVPVHELGIDAEGRIFFTMTLVRGKTLGRVFELARAGVEGWTLARALQVILRVCETMAFAHEKGVVHRDLKPENVMVGRFGETYVMDWGVAKVRGVADLHDVRPRRAGDGAHAPVVSRRGDPADPRQSPIMTMDGVVIGTPAYMPPEQAAGRIDEIGARSDVYAIGAMLYELLTGRAPYTEPGRTHSPWDVLEAVEAGPPTPVQEIDPRHSEEIQAICEKAMARRPQDRYSSAVDLAEDVQRYLDGRVVLAHKTGAVIELRKWVQRNRAVAATVCVAAVALVGLTGWFVDRLQHEKDVAEQQRDRARDAEAEAARATAEQARHEKAAALELARAVALANASALAQADDPMQALLLAREAARITLAPQVVTRLRSALRATLEVGMLDGHDDELHDVAASPDGTRIATASNDGTAILWSRDGERLAVLSGHRAAVTAVRFAPDGGSVATASYDGTARLWDLEGTALAVYPVGDTEVEDVRFSRDGRRVVLVTGDGAAVFDTGGQHVVTVRPAELIRDARLLPGGETLATISDDGLGIVWDVEGRRRASFEIGVPGIARSLDASSDGERLLTVNSDGVVQLWARDGSALRTLEGKHGAAILARFSPDGRRVAAAGGIGFEVWDADGRRIVSERSLIGDVSDLRWSARGERILVASKSGRVDLRSADGSLVAALRGHTDRVTAAHFVPGTELVVSASWDGTARLWAPEGASGSGGPAATLSGHRGAVTVVTFSADDRRILTGSIDRTARLWDADGNQLLVLEGHETPVTYACFSPDGTRLLTACAQLLSKETPGSARLWDLEGNELVRFDGHGFGITQATFRPDGQRVITAGLDGVARIWLLDGTELGALDLGRMNPLLSAVFTPDGERLVTSSYRGRLRLFDMQATLLRTYRATPRTGIGRVRFSPDGEHFVAACVDSSAWMYALDRQESLRFRGHEGWVVSAEFSPDGSHVLTASQDGTARIWDLQGRQVDMIAGHRGPVLCAAYAHGGDRVVTAGADRVARVWDIGGAALLAQAEQRVTRGLTMAEREHFADLLGPENRRLVGARAYVEDLSRRLVVRGDVLERVREDPALDDAFRAAALQAAKDLPPDRSSWLVEDYWPIVRSPGCSAEEYARALRLAEAALRAEPWKRQLRVGLGVALCRAGAYERSIAMLRETVARASRAAGSELPGGTSAEHAFLALAHHRLGRDDEARAHLASARVLLAAEGESGDRSFVEEAAAAIDGE